MHVCVIVQNVQVRNIYTYMYVRTRICTCTYHSMYNVYVLVCTFDNEPSFDIKRILYVNTCKCTCTCTLCFCLTTAILSVSCDIQQNTYLCTQMYVIHTYMYVDWIWENPGSIKMEILLYIHVRTMYLHVASIMSVYTAKYEHLQLYCQ